MTDEQYRTWVGDEELAAREAMAQDVGTPVTEAEAETVLRLGIPEGATAQDILDMGSLKGAKPIIEQLPEDELTVSGEAATSGYVAAVDPAYPNAEPTVLKVNEDNTVEVKPKKTRTKKS